MFRDVEITAEYGTMNVAMLRICPALLLGKASVCAKRCNLCKLPGHMAQCAHVQLTFP